MIFDDATGLGTVTITDYAQSSLGDVVFVELPSLGTEVTQGGAFLLLACGIVCVVFICAIRQIKLALLKV